MNYRKFALFLCCLVVGFTGCSDSLVTDPDKESPTVIRSDDDLDTQSTDATAPTIEVTIYDPSKAYNGSTLLGDAYNNRLIEVGMEGNIIWEYSVPGEYIKEPIIGLEGEMLPNGHILISISNSGLYEVDRSGMEYWSYSDPKISHDADRLEDGSTIYVFGNKDTVDDTLVKVVSPQGEIIWSWKASDNYLTRFPYETYAIQGYAHVNGVQRLSNGNTMVSLRNFSLTTILDANGDIVREYDWSVYGTRPDPHDPVMYEDTGSLVVCLQNDAPYIAVEIDAKTEEIIWSYSNDNIRTARDCNKLPNGNFLIVAVDQGGTENEVSMDDDTAVIFEITESGEIVWKLEYKNNPVGKLPGWFFKAERIRSE